MKKIILTFASIFIGVFVLFVVLVYKSGVDIATLAFFFAILIYIVLYFSVNAKGKNSKLVNMRSFGVGNVFSYNSELIVDEITKLENQVGDTESGGKLVKRFLFAMGTFYLGICVVYGVII